MSTLGEGKEFRKVLRYIILLRFCRKTSSRCLYLGYKRYNISALCSMDVMAVLVTYGDYCESRT
jgi:hypothetical protein